jgi:ElaA protein
MENGKRKVKDSAKLHWHWNALEQMGPGLLYDLLAFRESIFVVEQNCAYLELDGLDKTALHLLMLEDQKVVACLRLLPPDEREIRVRIGRVAVSAEWRMCGLAAVMMQRAMDKVISDYPGSGIFLHAQSYLQAFYLSLGFQVCGPEFLEDGIPHIPMELPAAG